MSSHGMHSLSNPSLPPKVPLILPQPKIPSPPSRQELGPLSLSVPCAHKLFAPAAPNAQVPRGSDSEMPALSSPMRIVWDVPSVICPIFSATFIPITPRVLG